MKKAVIILGRGLNALSWLGLRLSALALVSIVVATCWEVAVRYFLNTSVEWVGDSVGYFLCIAIFLAIPEVARQRGHVAITLLSEILPVKASRVLGGIIYLLAAAACLLAAWLCTDETIRQLTRGVYTVGTFTVPKWWISAFIAFGFGLTGIQFLRLATQGASEQIPLASQIPS